LKPAITGGCLCGAIRYLYTGQPGEANYCYCEDCRRITGSAFNIGIRFARANFSLARGEVRRYKKQADSGRTITRAFCPDCGSPLFTESALHPDLVVVKSGTLDDPTIVKPSFAIFGQKKVDWAEAPKGIRIYSQGREPSRNSL
jgi:hypothetical protein